MWQRSTKERRGDGSYLVLNGQCLGAAVNVVWCLLLCLVTGRGGVEVVSIRDADVQFSQCSGQGNQAGGGRRAARGVRGSGAPGGGLSGQDSLERERVRALQASRPGLA